VFLVLNDEFLLHLLLDASFISFLVRSFSF
jgi:hypothetical protein